MNGKRVLYIMGIDWDWIYQRPQIFAEKLAQDYQVTVVFPRSITKRNPKLPNVPNLEFRILWTLPYQEKNGFIGGLSGMINAKVFRDLADFQYIYVGYPLYARYIRENYQGKIIYDCMDNHEALYPDQKRVERVIAQEDKLICRCDLLVASSILLQEKVDAKAGYFKSVLIRNGVAVKDTCEMKQPVIKSTYSLCYIGTISEWFDYSVIVDSLSQLQNIEYHLIGPVIKREDAPKIVWL